jgi:hypothetical protein
MNVTIPGMLALGVGGAALGYAGPLAVQRATHDSEASVAALVPLLGGVVGGLGVGTTLMSIADHMPMGPAADARLALGKVLVGVGIGAALGATAYLQLNTRNPA